MSEMLRNVDKKKNLIMEIIKNIDNGKQVKELYDLHQDILQSITPFDVFAIPAFETNSDFQDDAIILMASKLMNLFHAALENYTWDKKNAPRYIQNHLEETKQVIASFDKLKEFLKSPDWFDQKEKIKKYVLDITEVEKLFLKNQNILYPRLESYLSSTRPLQIMWTLEDSVKKMLQELLQDIKYIGREDLVQRIGRFFFLTRNVLDRVRLLVLPIASFYVKENEWTEMLAEAFEIGYIVPTVKQENGVENQRTTLKDTSDPFLQNIFLVLDQLTVDITFVDEMDVVRYFNNTKDRLFIRSKSVIGRKVQNCHPKASMHVVEEILTRFKSKEQREAEFYIQVKGKMLYILYRAIYDENDTYKGTLEITQDVTHIRSLQGEKRLLDERYE